MPRELWSDILAHYLNYVSNLQPVLEHTRRFLLDNDAKKIVNKDYLDAEMEKEEKRSVHKVKAISEFTAMIRREVFGMIWGYIEETQEYFEPADIKDYTIDFLEEAISALKIMEDITNPDQVNVEKTLLYRSIHFIQDKIFPQGESLEDIYDILIDNSVEYYDVQRHILKPATWHREKLDRSEVPGLSPNVYKIINEITSLFNLDPNYMESPEDPSIDIPVILKDDVFAPFIDKIANQEEEALNRILTRLGLRLYDGIFIGMTKRLIYNIEPYNYINRKKVSEDKERILPQLSNETLILLYLAKASYRRGFLSKELINWISSNIAFLIYNGILKAIVSDDNIFYPIFTDLKTEEKILPYLMKLSCFEHYLRIDRTKIRDSTQYRKEIFNSLGSQIDDLQKISEEVAEYIIKILEDD